jgi:ferrous-iron efflux pump FieF
MTAPQVADDRDAHVPGDRPALMRRATLASLAVAVTLISAKLVGWLITGSVSVLTSLVDSCLDLGASAVTLFAVRYALKPADEDHRFGHGKAEALAGLIQAGFITASACGLVLAIVSRLRNPAPVQEETVGVVLMVLSIALTLALVAYQRHVVRRTGSVAIGADAVHYRADLATNIVVIAALLLAGRADLTWIDPVAAAAIALYLLHGAWQAGTGAWNILMDRELPDAERERIVEAVRGHPAVRGVRDLRTRASGLRQFIQVHIDLDPDLSLARAHVIGEEVEARIRAVMPDAEVIMHQDPAGLVARRRTSPGA